MLDPNHINDIVEHYVMVQRHKLREHSDLRQEYRKELIKLMRKDVYNTEAMDQLKAEYLARKKLLTGNESELSSEINKIATDIYDTVRKYTSE